MPRTRNQTLKILFLERYLKEKTDADHPATMADLLESLSNAGITAERKSIYDDLANLKEVGMDIQSKRLGSITGYYLGKREFELPELKLLVDAVQSSKFITEAMSLNMIDRLEGLASVHQAKQLRRQVWVRGRIKTMNESVFKNVDMINEAIEADYQIAFKYFTWDRSKKRILRRGGELYTINPWALLMDDEKYYLLASEDGVMKHFRVDKMLEIRLIEKAREGKEAFDKLDMAAYTDSHFGMFAGESTQVKLLFKNYFAGVAIDFFGMDTIMIPEDGEHFSVTVNVAVNEQFYGWLTGLGTGVQILSPQSAADGMRDHLAAIGQLYPVKPLSSLLSVYDNILFVDTETTGFTAGIDHLTEFSAIRLTQDGEEAYSTLVQLPEGVTIPEEVTAKTNITEEMCASGISAEELKAKILELTAGNTLLVAYNAQFDASFLIELAGPLDVDYLDALTVYRDRAVAPHKLSDAIAHYGVDGVNSHRASDDTRALVEVTKALEKEKNNLLYYVNRFGYKAKYGFRGKQIERVAYYAQLE